MGNYKVVKEAISFELANFLFNYFLLKEKQFIICIQITGCMTMAY